MVTLKKENVLSLNIREVYGMTKMYPANKVAQLFCSIAKAKSLTSANVKDAIALGFSVHVDRENFDPCTVKGIIRDKKEGVL